MFGLEVALDATTPQFRHALLRVHGDSMLHAFELPENCHAAASTAMLDRGHIDHVAFTVPDASTFDAVRQRLVERDATDGVVYDGGATHTVNFTDPDGMWSEVVLVVDREMRDVHEPRPLTAAVSSV